MSGNKTFSKRLADLERLLPAQEAKYHQIIIQECEDADAQIAQMLASGSAKTGDRFIVRRIVSPQQEMPGSETYGVTL